MPAAEKSHEEQSKYTLYLRNVPRRLKTKLKSICALNGKTMQDQILDLIEDFVKQNVPDKPMKKRKPYITVEDE